MAEKERIRELALKKIMILDGATGTELQKRGMPSGVSPEIWACENREVQKSIHKSYIDAGSDIIYTCTFGANYYKLLQYGRSDVEKVNEQLASLAKEAARGRAFVAGDIGPCGHFIEPFGEISFNDAVAAFRRQVKGLLSGGADLFVIETQLDIQEARAALIAVRELTDAFTIVTMTYESGGRTLNGTTPEAALVTLQSLGADAVGCNCSTGPEEMLDLVRRMKKLAKVPLAAKPNAGMPRIEGGKTLFPMGPQEFAGYAKTFAEAGVNFLGGCCGTTPEHISLLSAEAVKYAPAMKAAGEEGRARAGMVSSPSEALVFDSDSPLLVIGERINPTGKKKLQKELLEGNLSTVREMAKQQKLDGASLLDINAGMPGIDEKETVLKIIRMLSSSCTLPLVIDSSSPETVEAALRLYPGRALINSISGEKWKMEKLLPAAAKYGAMFILLPVTDNELPETGERRGEIALGVFREAQKFGFERNDIIIDGLVMTVSSGRYAALETLKTVRWATENSFFSVIGLSNVSFGLPERGWVNSSFLAMAAANRLTHVIANPSDRQVMLARYSADLLGGKDRDASVFLKKGPLLAERERAGGQAPGKGGSPAAAGEAAAGGAAPVSESSAGTEDAIRGGIISGIREEIAGYVSKAVREGHKPAEILENVMVPAILHVGELYDSRQYFLPQLIASAETMKKGFEILEPLLESGSAKSRGKIIFATVEGDIHDIGKNIVVLMLRNYGFEVLDLGKDVPAVKIIDAAKEFRPDIIALSALMTTTMVKIPEVMELAGKEKIKASFMAGGAVVTREWAESNGASYSRDGVEAVKVALRLVSAG